MKSISINNMFSNISTNTILDKDATMQNLKLLLETSKGELFGDPYFGTNLKKMIYDQNDVILKDLVIDDIYTAIKTFMPQIEVDRKDISAEVKPNGNKAVLQVTMSALNKLTYETNLYNIALFSENV